MLSQVCLALLVIIECYAYHNSWNSNYNHHKIPQDVMVDVVNNLALKLLAIHNEGNDNNIAISPYGALSVLVALGEGLRGEAVYEIQKAAKIPSDIAVVRVGLRDIHRHLKSYFIPEEGFLSGLSLSHENVTLNREYEDILRFYGYDVDAFNSALYPEFFTTTTEIMTTNTETMENKEENNETTTETITTEVTESDRVSVSESTVVTTEAAIVTTTETVLPTVTTAKTDRITRSESTVIPTTLSSIPATSTGAESTVITTEAAVTITSPSIPVTESATIPTESTIANIPVTTSQSASTSAITDKTTEATPNVPITTSESASTSAITEMTDLQTENSIKMTEISTSANAITTEMPEVELIEDKNSETLSEIKLTTVYTETESMATAESSTSSTALESSTMTEEVESFGDDGENSTLSEIKMTRVESSTATETSTRVTIPTVEITTAESSSSTEIISTQGLSELEMATKISTESSSSSETVSTNGLSELKMATKVSTETSSSTEAVSTEGIDTKSLSKNSNTSARAHHHHSDKHRRTRSVVDYVIARYYDEHFITQRPPPLASENELYFLINGKHKEYNINYMTYDTVLPFHYIHHLNSLALRFPLDSSRYYLLLLLPENREDIDRLICNLRLNTSLKYIIENLRYTHVKAVIPSFMLKGYIVLTSTLQKMGIHKVFEPRQADFSPMTDDKNIYVTNIEQAITVNIRNYVDPASMNSNRYLHQDNPVLFQADHPFLYFVIDSEINVTLMAGKVVNPLNSRIR